MAHNGFQHTYAIPDSTQIGFTRSPRHLQARHFCDTQTRLQCAHGHFRLDLKSGSRKIEVFEVATVKGAEAVAQVGEFGAVEGVEYAQQESVAQPTEPGDV